MSDSKHWPGPWEFLGGTRVYAPHPDAWHKDVFVPVLALLSGPANGRLAAAAPDLLAVAKRARAELGLALDILGQPEGHGAWTILRLLDAAIAKAESSP